MGISSLVVAVRGIGDVGSAIAHRLFQAGHKVWIHDDPLPSAPRRGMSFADAAFDGSAVLEGVTATRYENPNRFAKALQAGREIPVFVGNLFEMLSYLDPSVLVDARMRKHGEPERQTSLAPFTVALGPNLEAGETASVVVETQWGDDLGKVITSGRTKPLEGEPRSYGGFSRERFVHAPVDGVFHTDRKIGDRVEPGELVAWMEDLLLTASLSGILRGLVHDSVPVTRGAKVIEVDPRGDPAHVFGIGERPRRIAEGVLEAIQARSSALRGEDQVVAQSAPAGEHLHP